MINFIVPKSNGDISIYGNCLAESQLPDGAIVVPEMPHCPFGMRMHWNGNAIEYIPGVPESMLDPVLPPLAIP